MSTSADSSVGKDPWQDLPPECRIYPEAQWFLKLLKDYLGDIVRFVDRPDARPREVVLVECIESMNNINDARKRYPSHAVVGVVGGEDAARILEILASGADGVIAMTETPNEWRECLHVVLGGGRWLGGPGLEVKLQNKYSSYDIAKNDRHSGDVTKRTKLFVKGRVGDKVCN